MRKFCKECANEKGLMEQLEIGDEIVEKEKCFECPLKEIEEHKVKNNEISH